MNLSKSTVHYALQNNPSISAETRQRVHEAARLAGYRRNPVISALTHELRKGRASNFHGVLCYLCDSPHHEAPGNPWAEFLIGARDRAYELGYNLEHFGWWGPGKTMKKLRQILETRGIDGVLLAPTADGKMKFDFAWSRFATVSVGYRTKSPKLHSVHCDHLAVMKMALQELRKRNYRRPGLILSERACEYDDKAMVAQYLLGASEHFPGSDIPPLIMPVPWIFGPRELRAWLDKHSPDVIIASEEFVFNWVRDLSLRVPDELGFLCLDTSSWSMKMSGVDNQERLVGRYAAQLLISNLMIHEIGIPENPLCQLIQPGWHEGSTLRMAPADATEPTVPADIAGTP